MTLSTDDHFLIGKSHIDHGDPCQDYASSQAQGALAYAIVCDGCSSGKRTDVGARIVALSTARAVQDHWNRKGLLPLPSSVLLGQELLLQLARHQFGLVMEDLLATCNYAVVSPLGGFVHTIGDGIVAWKKRDGSLVLYQYEWETNTPYYPAYYESRTRFVQTHGGDLEALRLVRDGWIISPDGATQPCDQVMYSLGEGMEGIVIPFSLEELAQIEFVAVFSDGPAQFGSPGKFLDWNNVAQTLLAFKSSAGSFVKRRMNMMVRQSAQAGHVPIDDLAMAVIHLEHAQSQAEELTSNPA